MPDQPSVPVTEPSSHEEAAKKSWVETHIDREIALPIIASWRCQYEDDIDMRTVQEIDEERSTPGWEFSRETKPLWGIMVAMGLYDREPMNYTSTTLKKMWYVGGKLYMLTFKATDIFLPNKLREFYLTDISQHQPTS